MIDWTSFNKPSEIDGATGSRIRYSYGPDHERIQKLVGGTSDSKETLYYSETFKHEETRVAGNTTESVYRVSIPLGTTTMEMVLEDNGDYKEQQFLLTDHLGSPEVILDENMEVVERLSFDPWGMRRNTDGSAPSAAITSVSPIGYTGHEMDDEQSLVNMKARIYDPVLGRFLSPDSIIPDVKDLQSFNRYSYTRNNPLSRTDPTGHWDDNGGDQLEGYGGNAEGENDNGGESEDAPEDPTGSRTTTYSGKPGDDVRTSDNPTEQDKKNYVVSRDVGFDNVHGYTALGADYVGDPNANTRSYGSDVGTSGSLLGGGDLKPASDKTNGYDREHWAGKPDGAVEIVDEHGNAVSIESLENALDRMDEYLEENDVHYNPYGGATSNSALQDALSAGAGTEVDIPNNLDQAAPGENYDVPGFSGSGGEK